MFPGRIISISSIISGIRYANKLRDLRKIFQLVAFQEKIFTLSGRFEGAENNILKVGEGYQSTTTNLNQLSVILFWTSPSAKQSIRPVWIVKCFERTEVWIGYREISRLSPWSWNIPANPKLIPRTIYVHILYKLDYCRFVHRYGYRKIQQWENYDDDPRSYLITSHPMKIQMICPGDCELC